MKIEIHPEAEAELFAAAAWYDDQLPGLGTYPERILVLAFVHSSRRPFYWAERAGD